MNRRDPASSGGRPLLLVPALILAGCLERIRPEPEPLDPRFYAGAPDAPMGAGAGAASQRPFADWEGERVTVSGEILWPDGGVVDLDLWGPAPDEGERAHHGKVPLQPVGPFALEVPRGLGVLVIEALQDLTGDGPTPDDPFGMVEVEVQEGAIEGLAIPLALGVAGKAALPGGEPAPFADWDGEWVTFSGEVRWEEPVEVELGLWAADPLAPGSRTLAGKLRGVVPGPVEFKVPRGFGGLTVEAFHDLAGDGPTAEDPFGSVAVVVGDEPVQGQVIQLLPGGAAAQLSGAAGALEGGTGDGALRPFADWDGAWVQVSLDVRWPEPVGVAVDLWSTDPSAPGNRTRLGRIAGQSGSPVAFEVPRDFGGLTVEVFHDVTEDGPTPDDPFGMVALTVGAVPIRDQEVVLERGRAGQGLPAAGGGTHTHVEAPPGAPGGDPVAGTPVGPGTADPFASSSGARVTVRGVVRHARADAVVDLDVYRVDPLGPGGRAFAGKFKLRPGPFEIALPAALEAVMLEAVVDVDGDGPTPGDPVASCPCNPLSLRGGDVEGIELSLP